MTSWTPAALAAEMTAIHVLIKSESAGGGQGEWGGSGCRAEFVSVRCILLRDVAVSHRRSLDVRASSLFYQKSIYLSIYGPEWAAGWAGIGPAALPGAIGHGHQSLQLPPSQPLRARMKVGEIGTYIPGHCTLDFNQVKRVEPGLEVRGCVSTTP